MKVPSSAFRAPRSVLVCVGSELLRGKVNTHASHVSLRLASVGLSLNEETTVGDALPEITAVLERALDHFDVILVSGGLGPTFDDLTREAAAEATGRSLRLSEPLLRGLKAKFRRARYPMPEANKRQAYVLEGAMVIPNDIGTAPGQWIELHPSPPPPSAKATGGLPSEAAGEGGRGNKGEGYGQILILLPGPPRELSPMLERFVLPQLKKAFPVRPTAEAHLHFVGVPESVVDHKIRPIIKRYSIPHPNPLPSRERAKGEGWSSPRIQFTILAHLGLVDVDVFVSHPSPTRAGATLARLVNAIRKAVGNAWYGSDDNYPLEKVVGDHLRHKRATLAVAESCTGGMLASRLTDVPGSSDYFLEGIVTYANSAKMRALGVPEVLLRKYGAVSKPVALAMASAARKRAGATWGVGITGIAGPGGGTPAKPVGLVYIALGSQNGSFCNVYRFTGNRDAIRQRSVLAALDLLRRI